MIPPDHYALYLRCRRKAEQELERNDLLTAAEMMWGAVVHAIKHIASQYTSESLNSHAEIKRVVPAMDEQIPNVNLRRLFGDGETLHRYFYRAHLTDHQVRNSIRQCQRLLDLLLA